MKVLVCGSRTWNDWRRLETRLSALPPYTHIIAGGAQGADMMAGQFAIGRKWPFTEIRADWKTHGKAAGPIRNRQMLDLLVSPEDFVIAFHEDLEHSKGTKDTVTEATRRGIKVEVISS